MSFSLAIIRTNSTWIWFGLILLLTFCIIQVPAQDTFEPESEVIPSNGGRRRYDRFENWMKVISDFFAEGNWLNGGPDNLIEYIVRTLSKLLNILLHREEPPPAIEPNDDAIRYDTPVRDHSRTRPFDRQKFNINNILRMIPTDQLNLDG